MLNLVRNLFKRRVPDQAVILLTALVTGLATGLGAIFFRWLIGQVSHVSFQWLPAVTGGLGPTYLILAPVVGGLLVGLLVHHFAPEAQGHGVPEVMEAVALKNGRIRPVVALIKSLASALCIGTGGSVGREGPIVQIGSAIGSTIGQTLKLSADRVRGLVACGAAGGIAATFNAPIAGALFALEVILGDFGVPAFGSVVVAAVTASVVGRSAFGDVPAFAVPEYALNSAWEFPAYLLLGLLAALVGTVYTRAVYGAEDACASWTRVPPWLRPALGGGLLGMLALAYGQIPGLSFDVIPQVFGVGYETIESALRGDLTLTVLVALLGLKIAATAITLGSGGSGGIFAPSLFIGAMLGGAFGLLVNAVMPELAGPVGAYALVGMGAAFAASTHAILTAVIIMFELTGNYRIILPMLLAVGVASLLSRYLLKRETIYTLKLSRRGVRLYRGRDVDVLQRVRVADVMTRDIVTVRPETSLVELTDLFLRTNRHAFPVLDPQERICGMISLSDVRRNAGSADDGPRQVGEIMTHDVLTAFPDETLDLVLGRMGPGDFSRLPVVSREDSGLVVGVVRRNDIVRAYNVALTRARSDPAI